MRAITNDKSAEYVIDEINRQTAEAKAKFPKLFQDFEIIEAYNWEGEASTLSDWTLDEETNPEVAEMVKFIEAI